MATVTVFDRPPSRQPPVDPSALPDFGLVWRELWADPDFVAWLAWADRRLPGIRAEFVAQFDHDLSETVL